MPKEYFFPFGNQKEVEGMNTTLDVNIQAENFYKVKTCGLHGGDIPSDMEYAAIGENYICVQCLDNITPRELLQLCGFNTWIDEETPTASRDEILLAYKKCTRSIAKERAAFKAEMLSMRKKTMLNNALKIYCYEQTAYYMTKFIPCSGEDAIVFSFTDPQLSRLIELCDEGKFIETIVMRLLDMDTVHYSNMEEVGEFISETLRVAG